MLLPCNSPKEAVYGSVSLNVESLGPDEAKAHSIPACVVIQEGYSVKRMPAFLIVLILAGLIFSLV